MPPKKIRFRVRERKLGRENALGLAWQGTGLIELDPRLSPKKRLEVLLHEGLHHIFQDKSETEINEAGELLAGLLWRQDYRRVYAEKMPA